MDYGHPTERSTMSYEQITTDIAEGVLTITMNRPERLNAWTPTMEHCRESTK